MNRQRWAGLLLVLALVYVVVYAGGQAAGFVNRFLPRPHEEIQTPADPYANLTPVQIGEKVFARQGCQACHQIGLVGGTLGPSLSNVGMRRSKDWLYQQLENPQEAAPGNYMPSYAHLTHPEKDGLVAYMLSLNKDRQGPETGQGDAPAAVPGAAPKKQYDSALIERGNQLFASNGCTACHTINGQGGSIGPNLTREGLRRRLGEWQKQHLKDPLSVYTSAATAGIAWPMPSFARLSDAELDALVAYLQSLR